MTATQYRVLGAFPPSGADTDVNTLATVLDWSPRYLQNLRHVLVTLEQDALVSRRPIDGRRYTWRITAAGRAAYAQEQARRAAREGVTP